MLSVPSFNSYADNIFISYKVGFNDVGETAADLLPYTSVTIRSWKEIAVTRFGFKFDAICWKYHHTS